VSTSCARTINDHIGEPISRGQGAGGAGRCFAAYTLQLKGVEGTAAHHRPIPRHDVRVVATIGHRRRVICRRRRPSCPPHPRSGPTLRGPAVLTVVPSAVRRVSIAAAPLRRAHR
jgi:hypothetical protein